MEESKQELDKKDINMKAKARNNLSFLTLLGIIFIILKLTGSVSWTWWAILSPFWIVPILIIIAFVAFCLLELIIG